MKSEMLHISDTALLVAAARAYETELEDGLVRDPYAKLLTGERGAAIWQNFKASRWMSFGIGLRSRFIDEFLMRELSAGTIDCVLSLGAGLDARPWRLNLPQELPWLEVDFEPILDYKYALLKDVSPKCHLQRIAADINRQRDRSEVLDAALKCGSRILLLTEGLLFYLPASTVRDLAKETAALPQCRRWVIDIVSSVYSRQSRADGMEAEEILSTLRDVGWMVSEKNTFRQNGAAFAIERMKLNGWVPDPNALSPPADDPAGAWLFGR